MTKYVLGYAAGYVLPSVRGGNTFYVMTSVSRYNMVCGQRIWRREEEVTVYKTREEAELVARTGQEISDQAKTGARWFWRIWVYETDNPQNAKGLDLLDATKQSFGWVSKDAIAEDLANML